MCAHTRCRHLSTPAGPSTGQGPGQTGTPGTLGADGREGMAVWEARARERRDDEESHRESPGFFTVGRHRFCRCQTLGFILLLVLVMEPQLPPTATAPSQSLTASLFPGPLQTAAEERILLKQVPSLGSSTVPHINHKFTNVPKTTPGVTSPSKPGRKTDTRPSSGQESGKPHG